VRRVAIVAVLLAGCSGGGAVAADAALDAASPDAPGDWDGDFFWRVRVGATPDQILPSVSIDGVSGETFETQFAGEAASRAETVIVESFVDGRPGDRIVMAQDCDDFPWVYYGREDELCAYSSGELRRQIGTCATSPEGGGWHSDYLCSPKCNPRSCGADARCALDRVDGDLTHGWRACVAIGPRALGESCTIDAAGIDDCGVALYCLGSVCRRACTLYEQDTECPGERCDQVPGMSPGVLACLPT
jgi:hypothetical protein